MAILCTPLNGQIDFDVSGNESVLWVHEQSTNAGGQRLTRLAFRRAQAERSPRFRPLRLPGLTGRIEASAVRGDQLHAVFSDGSHWRFSPTSPGWHTVTPSIRFSEVNLPTDAVPMALACDAPNNSLYALVKLDWPADDAPIPAQETPWPIFRYTDGEWSFDRPGPATVPIDAVMLAMAARREALHLFYRVGTAELRVLHRVSPSAQSPWTEPTALIDTEYVVSIHPGWIDDRLTALAVKREMNEYSVRTIRAEGNGLRWGAALRDKTGNTLVLADAPRCAIFADLAVVAARDASGDVTVGSWSLPDGREVGGFAAVSALHLPVERVARKTRRQLVQYAVLALVLLAIFLRRRETVLVPAPLPPERAYARLAPRAMALLLDVALTSPVWAALLYAMLRSGAHDMTLDEQLAAGPEGIPETMFWSWAVVGAVVGVYGTVFEAVSGRTPGKRVTGCFVVGEGGKTGSFRVMVVRNLTRIIEFHFPALILLVLLTPGRQRLGDILARTFVTEVVARPPGKIPDG